MQCGDAYGGCRSRNIQEVNELNSGVHHDVRSQGQGVQQECGNSTTGPTQSSSFVFWCWLPPPMSVPAVGAGRPASGLDSQAQMCHFLVQGPHQPNV